MVSVTSDMDIAASSRALRQAAARTAALLRTAPEADAPVPGLVWSVAETAAHLVGGLQHYTAFVTGNEDAREYFQLAADAKTPAERAAVANARALDELAERDLGRLADMMVEAAANFVTVAAGRPHDELILTDTGLFMTVPVMTAAMLGEQLVHGLDIARAVRRRWPIARDDALLVIGGVMAMAPEYVDRQQTAGLHVAYELRFKGGPRYKLTIDDATAAVTAPDGRADCWIFADPAAFLLVGYGRAGQWGQALRGKIVVGGRKPWLGLKFGKILTSI